LIALGYSVYEVAPATLTATFLTSLVGIAAYQVLQAVHGGTIAPEWVLGGFLGAIACLVAARYIQTAVTDSPGPRPPSHIRTA
jgi:hypothetical protein